MKDSENTKLTEEQCFLIEYALQIGFEPVDKEGTSYICTERTLVTFAGGLIRDERYRKATPND